MQESCRAKMFALTKLFKSILSLVRLTSAPKLQPISILILNSLLKTKDQFIIATWLLYLHLDVGFTCSSTRPRRASRLLPLYFLVHQFRCLAVSRNSAVAIRYQSQKAMQIESGILSRTKDQ